MRVLVTGARDYRGKYLIGAVLQELKVEFGKHLIVIQGGAEGADP